MSGPSRSDVWRDFSLVFEEAKGVYSGFVTCLNCSKSLKHDRKTSGTTHLRRHAAACKSTVSKERCNSSIAKFFAKKKVFPERAKEKLSDAVVDFVADDLRPVSAVEGRGLRKLVDACIDIGTQYGKVEASNVLPSGFTVKRKLSIRADDEKKNLCSILKKAVTMNGMIGVTTDMWKDPKGRTSFP